MKPLSFAILALTALLASAQTPVPDACIIGCTEQVCLSLTNFTCFCSDGYINNSLQLVLQTIVLVQQQSSYTLWNVTSFLTPFDMLRCLECL